MASLPPVHILDWALPLLTEAHRYKVLYGGRGSGRSWSIARALLALAADRRLRVLCGRETQASIRASVHTLLSQQIDALGLDSFFEITEREVRCPGTGSVFFFEGLRANVDKLKSYEGIDVAWVEEAEHVTDESWRVLIPTIRKDASEIWINFNPNLESDPTYRRFVLGPPPDTWSIFVTANDNPKLPGVLRAEREYAYATDPESAAHVWGGECRTQSQLLVLAGKWRVEDFEPAPDWDGPYQGCDFGFAVSPTTLVRVWRHDHKLWIEHEAYLIGVTNSQAPPLFAAAVPDAEKYMTRCDAARPEGPIDLMRFGMKRAETAPKWKGSVEDGIDHLRSYEAIIIHSRCKHTIDEARHYRYKTNAAGDILPEVNPKNNHIIDAIRYALDPLIRRNRRVVRAYSPAAG